jgi:hypothetical protein
MAGAPEKVKWGTAIERAGRLMTDTAALLGKAESSDLWLIGVGKTQRAGFLFDALTASALGVPHTPHGVNRKSGQGNGRGPAAAAGSGVGEGEGAEGNDAGHPADGELLSTMGTGWSWPLVLDGSRFPMTSGLAARTLAPCPAIVCTYVRPHAADLPLRVDVPASLLGLPDRLMPHERGEAGRPWPAWVPEPEAMRPFVEAVLGAYGGISVYNAPLYAVDRIVRLPRRELELRYLPVCERAAGLDPGTLGINRGRRRFLIA